MPTIRFAISIGAGGDVTAPVLAINTSGVSGQVADMSVSSDEANGNLWSVATNNPTAPNGAQIEAGNDHNGAPALDQGPQAVSATGNQTAMSFSSLAAGDYYIHTVQKDNAGNYSNVITSPVLSVSAPAGVSAAIELRRGVNGAIAPAPFEFGVTLTGFDTPGPTGGDVYDRRLHEVYYFWSISDNYNFTAPLHVLNGVQSNGTFFGPRLGTVIRALGAVTVSCLAVEPRSGKFATTPNFTINLTDPDTAFTGVDNIHVDPDGIHANAPAGASLQTTIAGAMGLCLGQEATPKRIILRNGVTHTNGGISINGQNHPTIHIVAEAGGKADWTQTSVGFISNPTGSTPNRNLVCQNIRFQGPFDAVTATGAAIEQMQTFQNSVSGFILYDGCELDGFNFGVHTTGATQLGQQIFMNDCTGTNWRALINYIDAGYFYANGCRFFQKVGARGHYDIGNIPNTAIRCTNALTAIVNHCDLHAANGWFSNVPGIVTCQAAIRFMTSPERGAFFSVHTSVMEGGFNAMDIQSHAVGGSTIQAQQVNGVIRQNYLGTNCFGRFMFSVGHSGLSINSNIFVFANSRRLGGIFAPSSFVDFVPGPDGVAGDIGGATNDVSGNNCINLTDDTETLGNASNIPVLTNSMGTTVNEANNIVHQPNIPSPVTVSNLSTTVAFAPYYAGYFDSDTPLDPATVTPANSYATFRQEAGSGAIGAATGSLTDGAVPLVDVLGTQRTGSNHDAGAYASVA